MTDQIRKKINLYKLHGICIQFKLKKYNEIVIFLTTHFKVYEESTKLQNVKFYSIIN